MTGSDGRDASRAEGPGGFRGPGAGGSRGPASSTCEERAPCSPGTVDPRPPELRGHPCPWSRAAQRATAPCTAAGGTSTRPPTPRPEEDVSCQATGRGGSASARGGPAWGFSTPPRRPLCPQEAAPGSGRVGGAGDLLTPPLPSAGRGRQRSLSRFRELCHLLLLPFLSAGTAPGPACLGAEAEAGVAEAGSSPHSSCGGQRRLPVYTVPLLLASGLCRGPFARPSGCSLLLKDVACRAGPASGAPFSSGLLNS